MKRTTTRRHYRGPISYRPGELIRRHQPAKPPVKRSPFAAPLSGLRGDLREASAHGRRAARAYVDAEADRKRALADFLRAAEAGKYMEADAQMVKHRSAEHELRLAHNQLATCHSRLDRIEGEILSYERFS